MSAPAKLLLEHDSPPAAGASPSSRPRRLQTKSRCDSSGSRLGVRPPCSSPPPHLAQPFATSSDAEGRVPNLHEAAPRALAGAEELRETEVREEENGAGGGGLRREGDAGRAEGDKQGWSSLWRAVRAAGRATDLAAVWKHPFALARRNLAPLLPQLLLRATRILTV